MKPLRATEGDVRGPYLISVVGDRNLSTSSGGRGKAGVRCVSNYAR